MIDSLRCSKLKIVAALACVTAAAWLGRSTNAVGNDGIPVALAKPEMRLQVGPSSLLHLFATEIVRSELALTSEQQRQLDALHLIMAKRKGTFPTQGTPEEKHAFNLTIEKLSDEQFVGIERILLPAQKARLDEITLQLYLPYTFYAGLSLELDDYLGLSEQQRKRTYRYAFDNVSTVSAMYARGDRSDRLSWDEHRAEEREWSSKLLAELTEEQRARLKSLGGKEIRLEALQEQLWNAGIARALATGRLVQDPKPELWKRNPTTGARRGYTNDELQERMSVHEGEPGMPVRPATAMPRKLPPIMPQR